MNTEVEISEELKTKAGQQSNGKHNGKMDLHLQTPYSKDVDVNALEKELKKTITGEVRFDNGSRALYSTDASNYRQVPIGVVIPKSEEDIIQTINICRKYKAPLLSRGGGTSLPVNVATLRL